MSVDQQAEHPQHGASSISHWNDNRTSAPPDYHVILTALAERHDWRLLEMTDWLEQAQRLVTAQIIGDFRKAAIHVYSGALHKACLSEARTERYERGYHELTQYLYPIALRRSHDPDCSHELTQTAIYRIISTIESCRHAGAFLAFAIQKLRDGFKAMHRGELHGADSLDQQSDEQVSLYAACSDTAIPDPLNQVLAKERLHQLIKCRDAYLHQHPKYKRHFDTVWYKYVDGLSDDTIALLLATTKSNVHVMRHRMIEKLQQDPHWQACAAEIGIPINAIT